MSIFFRSLVAMIVAAMFAFVLASTSSAQQSFSVEAFSARPIVVQEVRNLKFQLDGNFGTKLKITIPYGQGPDGIAVREWELNKGFLDVRVRTDRSLLPGSYVIPFDIQDVATGYVQRVEVTLVVHKGMSDEVLAATSLIGATGYGVYSASLSPTDQNYYLRQSLIHFEVLMANFDPNSRVSPVSKADKIVRKNLVSNNWTIEKNASKRSLIDKIMDVQLREELESLEAAGKLADSKTSASFLATKDGDELIVFIWMDPIDQITRAIFAQNPAP